MTKNKHSVFNIIKIIVAVLLIVFFIVQIIIGLILVSDNEKINDIPYALYEVTSDSMYPKIKKGDGIIEDSTDYSKLVVGDIITICQDGEFITHEIIDITDGIITTKGSANIYNDEPITAESYVGKVVLILPGFSIFLEATKGWKKIIWIAAILLILFVPEIIFKFTESKKEKRNGQLKEPNNAFFNFTYNHKIKLALSAVLVATLFITPLLTNAQYVWKLNEFVVMRAKALYFDGNFMHDISRSSSYRTTGWDGIKQPLDGKNIEIRNFENALLTNATGEDIAYQFTWEIETWQYTSTVGGVKRYTKLTDANAYTIDKVTRGTEELTGSSAIAVLQGNGKPQAHSYTITIAQPTSGNTLPNDSYIKIKLYAKNVKINQQTQEIEEANTYKKEIGCTFQFVIGAGEGFVSKFDLQDEITVPPTNMLDLSFGTGEATSLKTDDQTITIWWKNTKLSIDPATILFQKFSSNYMSEYGSSNLLNEYSCITLTGLTSYYTGYLRFFKNTELTITYNEKTVNLNNTDQWFYLDETFHTSSILVAENMTPTASQTAYPQAIIGYYSGAKQDQ